MRCPFCAAEKESLQVIDSRTCDNGKSIRRRRKCVNCGKRFTTYERVEQTTRMMVIKKDGRRVPWDKDKIMAGLERACFKRPVPEEELHRIADEVEEEVRGAYDREVPSTEIGQLVIDKLRRLDQVAYVRFASVYREFKTLEDLVAEAKAVIDARHYDDVPGQGKLFVEPPAAKPSNGHPAADVPEGKPVRKPRKPRTPAISAAPVVLPVVD
ncbi:transcriptional regulator NrdR [Humisphaera borealis]|uniref:Transcriptional repressor NrdR n=1 Tax=Humisphaera borealis TaxID=2807512 RepID=A0A7M2WYQ5_9BACT|nr:transcriptional regulator NrdR [Humisphaera borealis]QOV90606.1 transcriptional repressor NrdR [Humisphaera borealis]